MSGSPTRVLGALFCWCQIRHNSLRIIGHHGQEDSIAKSNTVSHKHPISQRNDGHIQRLDRDPYSPIDQHRRPQLSMHLGLRLLTVLTTCHPEETEICTNDRWAVDELVQHDPDRRERDSCLEEVVPEMHDRQPTYGPAQLSAGPLLVPYCWLLGVPVSQRLSCVVP